METGLTGAPGVNAQSLVAKEPSSTLEAVTILLQLMVDSFASEKAWNEENATMNRAEVGVSCIFTKLSYRHP